jgi:hypothetical protein
MIELKRDRTKVPAAFRNPKRIDQALKLLEVDAQGKREFDSSYWKKAKNQLKKETHGKCAYCESPTANVAHGDVEHFRPKSVYWWLAYCYDNYLFSCQLCNQTFKKDSFPISPGAVKWADPAPLPPPNATLQQKRQFVESIAPDPLDNPALQAYLNNCRQEQALLINPYEDDPANFFVWEAEPVLKIVDIKPQPGNAVAQAFLDAVQKFYGLNRPELEASRWKTYKTLSALVKALKSNKLDAETTAETEDVIKEMMDDSAPYAGMCRYFVREIWNLNL